MKTWIALLRGINVGGKNIVSMKELRSMLEGLDLQNVQTYIQSGNCIFESATSSANELQDIIAESINKTFGFKPPVLVIAPETLADAIANNPYPESSETPKNLHLFFLSEKPADPDIAKLESLKHESEQFTLSGQVFYLYTSEGFHGSKVARTAEKSLGVPITGRNLNSAMKIAELANNRI